jgi:hypothetical protein
MSDTDRTVPLVAIALAVGYWLGWHTYRRRQLVLIRTLTPDQEGGR